MSGPIPPLLPPINPVAPTPEQSAAAKAKAEAEAKAKAAAAAKAAAEAKAKAEADAKTAKEEARKKAIAKAKADAAKAKADANQRKAGTAATTAMQKEQANIMKLLYSVQYTFDPSESSKTKKEQDLIIRINNYELKYKKSILDTVDTKNNPVFQNYNTLGTDKVITGADAFRTFLALPVGSKYKPYTGTSVPVPGVSGGPSTTKVFPPVTPPTTPAGPGGQGGSNPVNGPGKFIISQDNNGNPVYYWSNNKTPVSASLIGDPNGNMLLNSFYPQYERALTGAGLNADSPLSMDAAFSKLTHDLEGTPGAVDKMKDLLIAKHIIPPSAVNVSLSQKGVIDNSMAKALQWVVSATSAHNVSLFNLGKPNQKFIGVNDFLNNMNPLSITTTDTQKVYQKIMPKDYELSIDQMFQNTLGRGATKEELAHFSKQLQSYSDANPQLTTTTKTENTTGVPGNPSYNATVNQSGGVSQAAAGAEMRDEALHTKGAEEYNKGAKYFNWFQQAIGSTMQLGG